MGLHCLLRVICLVALVTSVHGTSGGALAGACSTLTPGHGGTTPATTVSPFSISFTPASFTPGGSAVNVTIATTALTGDAAQKFKGFLLTTQSTSDASVKPGTFALIAGSKFVCDPPNSTVTHDNSGEKTSMEFKWTPPTTSQGHVRFRATFLKDYSTYWVDVRAGSLLLDSTLPTPGPTTAGTTQAAVTTPAPVAPTGRLTNDAGCGSAKGCYSKCSGTDCDFVMTWEQGTNNSNVRMTLSGVVGDSQGSYIALGLSKDDKMSDDSVMYCIKEGVYNAYNNDGSKFSQRLSNGNEQAGLSDITATLKDGVLTCSFLRDTAASSNGQQFALDQNYTLFFATGSATPDYIGKHSQAPLISPLAASLQDFSVNIGGPTTQAAVTTPAPVAPTGRLTNDAGCGRAKGCYSKCSGTDCDFVMTWEQGTNNSNVRMTLSGIVGGSQGSYIALGLSKDDKMSDDSVMYCIKEGVYNAYNNDGSKFSQTLTNGNEQAGLSDITATLKDGVLICSFLRDTAASSDGQRFALNQDYTLFFATGLATPGSIGKHSQAPLISSLAASLQDFSVNIGGSADFPVLVKAHGSLMMVAWIFAASLGIIFARHFKTMWEGSSWFGEKVWFQIHRACMIIAFLATVVAFIIIFVEVGGYSEIEGEGYKEAHPIIGIIVTILTVINPVLAVFRPHPGTKNRPIFNWVHWAVGTAAYILGVISIFFGLTLDKAGAPDYATYILAAFVGWQFLVSILLEIAQCMGRNSGRSNMYEMSDMNGDGASKPPQVAETNFYKQVLIILHVFVVSGFTIALIVVLNIGSDE